MNILAQRLTTVLVFTRGTKKSCPVPASMFGHRDSFLKTEEGSQIPLSNQESGRAGLLFLKLGSGLRLILLLLKDLPYRTFREKDVIFFLEVGSEPSLPEPGFLPDLLEQLNA